MAANEWSEKTKMIVTIAIVVVVNIGMGAGLYYARGQWQKLEAEHKKLQDKVKGLQAEVAQGPEKELELKTLTDRFDKQAKLLPDSEEVGKLQDSVSKIANATGCKDKGWVIKAGGGAAKSAMGGAASYVQTRWGTKWEGDFMGFVKLLNEIEERFPRFISFEGLTITAKNQGLVPTGTAHEISVDMVTYRYSAKP